VKGSLSASRRVLLILDFDGTLSPLAETPDAAVLPLVIRQTLRRLTALPSVTVAIMSGRPVTYLRRMVGDRRVIYGGNHGLEMRGPRLSFIHSEARRLRTTVRAYASAWRSTLNLIPGALLENKGLSLGLHHRRVPARHLPAFHRLIDRLKRQTAGRPFRWRTGKKVWELLPDVAWNKGKAALWLMKKMKDPRPVVVGDDVTDEDMFRALRRRGTCIVVGRKRSAAGLYLAGQGEVPRLLRSLEKELSA